MRLTNDKSHIIRGIPLKDRKKRLNAFAIMVTLILRCKSKEMGELNDEFLACQNKSLRLFKSQRLLLSRVCLFTEGVKVFKNVVDARFCDYKP